MRLPPVATRKSPVTFIATSPKYVKIAVPATLSDE